MPVVMDSSVRHLQKCIDVCNKCMQACEECLTSCMKEPDIQARVKCMQLLRDCADICSFASQYMSRNSQFAKDLCGVKSAQMYVLNVLRSAGTWQACSNKIRYSRFNGCLKRGSLFYIGQKMFSFCEVF